MDLTTVTGEILNGKLHFLCSVIWHWQTVDLNSHRLLIILILQTHWLCEKCPNREIFLVRIFLYWVRIQENTDQKNIHLWTVFTQWATYLVVYTSNGMKSKTTKNNKVSIYLAYLLLAILFIVAHKLLIIWFLYSAFPFSHDACDSCIENKDES